MRFLDWMTPAKTPAEAALLKARLSTLSGGAALRSVLQQETALCAVEVKENPAVSKAEKTKHSVNLLRRAAYKQVLIKRF